MAFPATCVLRSKLTRITRPRGREALDGAEQPPQTTTWLNSKTTEIFFEYEMYSICRGFAPPKTRWSTNCSCLSSHAGGVGVVGLAGGVGVGGVGATTGAIENGLAPRAAAVLDQVFPPVP